MKKVLIANRGEIACRIIRGCRDAGLRTVAVFSDHDRSAQHVALADEAYALGGNAPSESYLRGEEIVRIAKLAGADAVHPGYGFLAENSSFARAVEDAGLVFIGPPADAIERLGDKTAARRIAGEQGVPTVPGTLEPIRDIAEAARVGARVGYPILLKAAAGGGGKGMRIVASEQELESSLRSARSEARNAFGDDRVYIEKYVTSPRHIEIQVLADGHGNAIYLGERECSIQRRHQKVIEESPSPAVGPEMRKAMGEAAVRLISAAGYRNAGTVEFIVDAEENFYFLEVNTRLQVEHPVTEMVTGIDLVEQQLRVAQGEKLSISQDDIRPEGWAIECRICAEDPANSFFPSSGALLEYSLPSGPFVRVENGFRKGDRIPVYYDSLLAKIITWGPERSTAIARMRRALGECIIRGVDTNLEFCSFVLTHEVFLSGAFNTGFIEKYFKSDLPLTENAPDGDVAALAATLVFRGRDNEYAGTPGSNRTTPESQWTRQRTKHYR